MQCTVFAVTTGTGGGGQVFALLLDQLVGFHATLVAGVRGHDTGGFDIGTAHQQARDSYEFANGIGAYLSQRHGRGELLVIGGRILGGNVLVTKGWKDSATTQWQNAEFVAACENGREFHGGGIFLLLLLVLFFLHSTSGIENIVVVVVVVCVAVVVRVVILIGILWILLLLLLLLLHL